MIRKLYVDKGQIPHYIAVVIDPNWLRARKFMGCFRARFRKRDYRVGQMVLRRSREELPLVVHELVHGGLVFVQNFLNTNHPNYRKLTPANKLMYRHECVARCVEGTFRQYLEKMGKRK